MLCQTRRAQGTRPFVSRLLARHRGEIGIRKGTRSLGCYRQALFVLAWYRDKADIPRLGAGSGLSRATSYRYVAEGTRVVSAQPPGNIQGLFYPDGLPMWVSDLLPGNVHDLAAAREMVLAVLRDYSGEMPALADCGYDGAGHGVLTPAKKPKGVKELDINARTRNMLLSYPGASS